MCVSVATLHLVVVEEEMHQGAYTLALNFDKDYYLPNRINGNNVCIEITIFHVWNFT